MNSALILTAHANVGRSGLGLYLPAATSALRNKAISSRFAAPQRLPLAGSQFAALLSLVRCSGAWITGAVAIALRHSDNAEATSKHAYAYAGSTL